MDELLSNPRLDEPSAKRPPKTRRIEQAIVLMANSVWAVVGLFLWIPQIVRVLLTSAARLIHAALTRQPIDSIRAPIRQVSRFYVDGFLTLAGEGRTGSYSSRQIRAGRFLIEALWVVAVWMLVLRLARPAIFHSVWQKLAATGRALWEWTDQTVLWIFERLPESVQSFIDLGKGTSIVLAILLVLFLATGFFLGRRRS